MTDAQNRFVEAFGKVLDIYGLDLLENTSRLNALLMDFAPYEDRARKIVCAALNQGIGGDLLKARTESSEQQQWYINKCILHLKNEMWLSDDAAKFVIDTICQVLGIGIIQISPSQSSDKKDSVLAKGVLAESEKEYKSALSSFTAIGFKALTANAMISEIEIPETITAIFPKAFKGCVRLGKVIIPHSVQAIGERVFEGCIELKSIFAEANQRYATVAGLFIDKKERSLIRAENKENTIKCVIPNRIVRICSFAFEQSRFQIVRLPNDLERIDNRAFYQCRQLRSFEISGSNSRFSTPQGILHNRARTVLVKYPPGRENKSYMLEEEVEQIADSAFCEATHLESITFTSSLRVVGRKAFEGCTGITSLILPNSVFSIGERAFQYCTNLSSVMLPRGIQEIDDYAFHGCSSIQNISIPVSVRKIGHFAFSGCTNLKKIVIQKNVSFIGSEAFCGCPQGLEIQISSNDYVVTYCRSHGLPYNLI